MSDYGRYSGGDTRSRNREFGGRDRGQNRNSIFNYGGSQDRFRERDDMGSSRRSFGDNRGRNEGRWTDERENFGRNRDRERSRERGSWDSDRDQSYGRDDYREGIPMDETSRLIASNKVEGTAVYGSDDERLGSIYNFMVDKRSGRAEYALLSYGGFLGMGQRYYPLPWKMLTYDVERGGYRINMTERDLEDAPSFDRQSEPRFDRSYGEHVHGWYGLNY